MRRRARTWQFRLALPAACAVLLAAPLAGLVDRASSDHGRFYGNPFEETAQAQTTPVDAAADEQHLQPSLFDELFDTVLPGQYREGDWSLRLNPKFGDFFDDDYVRLLAGVRYSFSNYFDALTEIGGYFANPFRDAGGAGLYTWRLGARYTWYDVAGSRANVAAGFNSEFPLANPPFELSDGYARYEPFVTASYRFTRLPRWLWYVNTTYQVVADAPLRAASPHIRAADRLFLRPGAIWYPGGRFRYSFELEYSTNALSWRRPPADAPAPADCERENWLLAHTEVHEIFAYPGITWFPTRKIRDGFIIPGNWDVSLRARIPVLEETGRGFSLSLRLRWYYDYRKFLREDLPGVFHRGGS